MASKPDIYNLVWRAFSFVSRPDPSQGKFQVAPEHLNTIDTRPNIPAVVLFPSLLTPNLHVRGENKGMIELLVAAPKSPALAIDDVNRHLKFAPGLDAKKRVTDDDLFDDPTGKIAVEPVERDAVGQLKTKGIFRGVLHDTVSNWLPKELDGFYAIQVHESCLAAASQGAGSPGADDGSGNSEYQDLQIRKVFKRLNGPALQGSGGFGTHEFELDGEGVDYSRVDLDQRIVAYHPLYVYPRGTLSEVSYGHVSDIHINARQKLLARSPARVIDAPSGTTESPAIGTLVSCFDSSLVSILAKMKGKGDDLDVLLVGGDLIEHIDNASPLPTDEQTEEKLAKSAAAVWKRVNVDDNYRQNYQANVDLIAFYTLIRDFCTAKPAFAIAGNHDAYGGRHIYGISPRALQLKAANEGIPADHNLTFYESILSFGESYADTSSLPLMKKSAFEWFYAAFTPFSDFSFELPKQRLVGLGWGEDEQRINWLPSVRSGGQGLGHLGRANESVTSQQLTLLKSIGAKKIVLMTHFTLVSYKDTIACGDEPVAGKVDNGETDLLGQHLIRKGQPYSDYDLGTFEKGRKELYDQVAAGKDLALVITGHSHRKGLYFVGQPTGHQYPTEGHALRLVRGVVADAASKIKGRTPIIVSDCAGPLPRLNLSHEFAEWGSDRPSGTIARVSAEGHVTNIEVVPSSAQRDKPRLAVAVDYMHVMKRHVFEKIEVEPFERAKINQIRHRITITFSKYFHNDLANDMDDLVLFCCPTPTSTWERIETTRTEFVAAMYEDRNNPYKASTAARAVFEVPEKQAHGFSIWLQLGPRSGRFMSFGFHGAAGLDDIYEYQTRWNLEVDAVPSIWNDFSSGAQGYEIQPNRNDDGTLVGEMANLFRFEAPDWTWRKQFSTYQ